MIIKNYTIGYQHMTFHYLLILTTMSISIYSHLDICLFDINIGIIFSDIFKFQGHHIFWHSMMQDMQLWKTNTAQSLRNDLSVLKLRFPALDSTDFCNGNYGLWASRRPRPPECILYPALICSAGKQPWLGVSCSFQVSGWSNTYYTVEHSLV